MTRLTYFPVLVRVFKSNVVLNRYFRFTTTDV